MGADRIKSQTDANQRKAADPGASVWVSASAGTGKTSVLISRLERLLLQGVRPERILCLTYTNAAAAEMQNRLYAELKDWAAMEGEVLAARLRALTGADADESVMARARQLFTLTLETKGGLKIHTIHGFCERLLHRFPLEAGIAPEFEVLDEAQAAELRQRAADRVLSAAASEPGSDLGVALADIVSRASEITFRDLLKRALRQSPPEADGEGDGAGTGGLASLLGLEAARGEGRAEEMAGVLDDGTLERAAAALDQGGTSDQQKAVAFRAVLAATGQRRVAALRDAFLTKQNEPFTTMATKAVCEAEPGLVGALETARDRFFELWLRDQAFEVLAANRSLDRLMRAIGAAYAAEKAARAALDYDDLIDRTAALLNSAEAAQWVLYKLDYGIDHILVDEAQDTSPLQWRVIGALAGEFFAGEGAREALRTVFAVGDEKQSIYGFQGARPEQFAQAGRAFEKRVKGARHRWERVPLNLSFRSAPAVLDAVDAVFAAPAPARGLTWGGEPVQHHANREGEHGLVEIWGTEVTERGETAAPFAPLDDDRAEPDAPTRLARRIAGQIDTWLREKTVLPSGGQPIEPGDILILVRKRHPFALPMIRALKDRAIPVAGADRMRLTEQLAVMDLMAFGEAMLTPRDDLALACALKSPLVGFDDDDLFALAHGRRGPLWEALEARSGEDERFAAAAAMLRTWRGRADYMAPYEFFSRLLEEDHGAARLALIARIGPDAGDAIDEFLNAALDYDAVNPPTLQGFLHWLARADLEVKRDLDQGRDEVRVMTVHGAKGLEAPIVFLPDTCTTPRGGGGASMLETAGGRIWVPPGGGRVPQMAAVKEEASAREIEEYHRLLYVAMTRARDRLYICGFEGTPGRQGGCWYDLVFDALTGRMTKAEEGGGTVWRLESGEAAAKGAAKAKTEAGRIERPHWAGRDVAGARGVLTITPSAVSAGWEETGVPRAFPGQAVMSPAALAEQSRFERGRLIHKLLQHLPDLDPGKREAVARRFVERNGSGLDEAERATCVEETLRLLNDDEFKELFAPGSRAEVPIVARLGETAEGAVVEVSGQIDRLVVGSDHILIADYKTNRPPPQRAEDAAPAYLAQLAAYRAALAPAFPGRAIRCALVWTAAPRLMAIPPGLLDGCAARLTGGISTGLDAPPGGT